jgi:hypothetical protein
MAIAAPALVPTTIAGAARKYSRIAAASAIERADSLPERPPGVIEVDPWVLGHSHLGFGSGSTLCKSAHYELEGAAEETEPIPSVNGG